mmetsp:Transcript_17066/g.31079  ORF Transcript_17066/g.31079 Transcript_17066/m.31079 type:complete len:142 (+) Transcript_17066:804-1229(+)
MALTEIKTSLDYQQRRDMNRETKMDLGAHLLSETFHASRAIKLNTPPPVLTNCSVILVRMGCFSLVLFSKIFFWCFFLPFLYIFLCLSFFSDFPTSRNPLLPCVDSSSSSSELSSSVSCPPWSFLCFSSTFSSYSSSYSSS